MTSNYQQAISVVLNNMPVCDDHEVTRDEAKDIVDALYGGGFLAVYVRPNAGRQFCLRCDFYTDHVSTAHDGLAQRGLLLTREELER